MPTYWGDQPFTSGPVYIGAVICFLFVFGTFIVGGRLKWWLITCTLLSFALAWGHNMMWLTDIFLITSLDIINFVSFNDFGNCRAYHSTFGILALNEFLSEHIDKKDVIKSLKYSLVLPELCLIFAFMGSFLFDFVSRGDTHYQIL